MNAQIEIVRTVLKHWPEVQAIYLFGSFGTDEEWPDSDIDIALLLPPQGAKNADLSFRSALHSELVKILGKEIDLINLRQVPTVLRKEVVAADRRIHAADEYAADEFEMLTLSYYQKLNEERAAIVADALASGRLVM